MISRARFILSRKAALERYNDLRGLCDSLSYSYKTNFEVGKVLEKNTDCDFSIHSIENLQDIDCKRAWFFAQGWDDDEMELIFKKKVSRFVVDNEKDLDALLKYLENSKDVNRKIDLLLRMRLKEHTVQTGKHFVYGMASSKINQLLRQLRKNKHIEKLGIHFHRKTQNVSEWGVLEELEDSIDAWDCIDYVNIGGGIPAEYKNYNSEVLKVIFQELKELREWLNSKKIKMIIEPGRYIAAYAVNLETHVVNIYDNNIIIDCSVFNAAMDTFLAHIRLLIEGELDETDKKGVAYTIKGCTPDSMDIFRYRVYLKDEKIGHKIVFLNAGAYNFNTNFCNLPKLETVVVD